MKAVIAAGALRRVLAVVTTFLVVLGNASSVIDLRAQALAHEGPGR